MTRRLRAGQRFSSCISPGRPAEPRSATPVKFQKPGLIMIMPAGSDSDARSPAESCVPHRRKRLHLASWKRLRLACARCNRSQCKPTRLTGTSPQTSERQTDLFK
jgi:hypothetical protein